MERNIIMKKIAASLLALLLLTGCGKPAAEYRKITPDEAKEKMVEGVVILDVRTQAEFDEGHIPGAILLPDTELSSRADQLLPDKGQTILVYCRSGRRSAASAKALAELGYTSVYDFGGIQDWTGEIVK